MTRIGGHPLRGWEFKGSPSRNVDRSIKAYKPDMWTQDAEHSYLSLREVSEIRLHATPFAYQGLRRQAGGY